jgi:uncharacterized protein (TIGR02145 family)
MESETILKNGVNPKNRKAKGNFLYSFMFLAASIFFSACDMGMETIDVSQKVIVFEHVQATHQIGLSRFDDNDVFSVAGETNWCTVDMASFTVSVSENKSSAKRTTTLVFSTDEWNKGTIEVTQNSREIDEANDRNGVVINGIRWATRNVDAPGTFAASPESVGMFYRWNTKVAHPTVLSGQAVSIWEKDVPVPSGSTWEKANDPSPAGWRVPTYKELMTLHNPKYPKEGYHTMYGYGTSNGINGIRYTDMQTGSSLFLPEFDDMYNHFWWGASYWSSTSYDSDKAYCFNTVGIDFKHNPSSYEDRRSRSSIRCVKE